MVTCEAFLNAVDAIQKTNPTYKLGASGDNGYCDCIGLIIGAIRRAGGKWNGIHGSNYAARFELSDGGIKTITSANQLEKGMAIFKRRDDTSKLPARYLQGGSYYTGDIHDYYHVGVVYSVSPLVIKHCTTGSNGKDILEDTKLGKWGYAGHLTLVDYDGTKQEESAGDKTMTQYMVTADGGVNFRQKASTSGNRICTIPQNEIVTGMAYNSEWLSVTYSGKTGYVMSKFLTEYEAVDDSTDDTAETTDTSSLEARLAELENRVEALEKSVGVG